MPTGIRRLWVGNQKLSAGTPIFGTAAPYMRNIRCTNFSFTPRANTYVPQEYGSDLTVEFQQVRGTRYAEFDLTVGARYMDIGWFLVGAFGLPTTTQVGSATQHAITITGGTAVAPTTATIGITFDGYTATASASATSATWDTALEALPSIGTGNVSVVGGPLNTATALTILFATNFTANHFPNVSLTTSAITAGSFTGPTITTQGNGAYQHVFTRGAANKPFLTLGEDDGTHFFRYKDCAINNWDFAFGIDDFVKFHCTGIASFETQSASASGLNLVTGLTTETYTNQPFDGTSLVITHMGGNYTLAKSGSIKGVENRNPIHAINNANGDVQAISEGRQTGTFDMMTRFSAYTSSNYAAFIANSDPTSLILSATGTTNSIGGNQTPTCTIQMLNPAFTEGKRDPMDASNEAVAQMSGVFLYDSTDTTPIKITLVNGQPTYNM